MSILVCTPMYGGQCTAAYFRSALALKEELTRLKMPHDWLVQWNESLITRARNIAAHTFLHDTRFEKLLFIDADIEFHPEDVARLWNLDTEIACGAYSMKTLDAYPSVWKDNMLVGLSELDGPTAVDYAGTGFLMIDRKVFEAIPAETYRSNVGETKAYFLDPIVDGVHQSEDFYFCDQARAAGFSIICDPAIRLKHWGTHGFGC